MLGAARTLARYDIKVIGINRGNLGFLTDLDPDNAQQQLADVLEGHYISEKRFLLEAQVCQQDCQKRISTAINEVVLHPGKVAHMIEFEVYIDEIFAFSQRSDGLIISTPTGSTAYSLCRRSYSDPLSGCDYPGAHVPAYVVSTTTGHKQQQHDPSAFFASP